MCERVFVCVCVCVFVFLHDFSDYTEELSHFQDLNVKEINWFYLDT